MKVIESLTQQKFQEILYYLYEKGQLNEDIKLADVIEEIRQRVLMEK